MEEVSHMNQDIDISQYTKVILDYKNEDCERFNGIIRYLTNTSNDIRKVIQAEASSIYEDRQSFKPSNILRLDDFCLFHSKDEEDANIVLDFKNRLIFPNYYSMKSRMNSNSHHLRSWKILGSNDKINWDLLDSRINDNSLFGTGYSNSFEIKTNESDNQYYRYIKILQTDVNSSFYFYLVLTSFELFGTLYELK